MTTRHLYVKGLEDWHRWLLRLERREVAVTKDRILRTGGLRLQERLDDLTPRRTGRLKDSMTVGKPGNVFEIQAGRTSFVFVGTAVPYAKWVNDGFEQKAGQFVPGFWKNGTFHYVPGDEAKARGIGGMVLTGKVIPGARMFEKSMDALEQDMPDILEFEFRRLYRLLFG